jgi:hypothetical protein
MKDESAIAEAPVRDSETVAIILNRGVNEGLEIVLMFPHLNCIESDG